MAHHSKTNGPETTLLLSGSCAGQAQLGTPMFWGFSCISDVHAGAWCGVCAELCQQILLQSGRAGIWSCLPFVPARLPWECRHIQLLQGSGSRAASFSIQLFQMLNHSVAYLHCELRVCLPSQPGCEQVLRAGSVPTAPRRDLVLPESPHQGHPVGTQSLVKVWDRSSWCGMVAVVGDP